MQVLVSNSCAHVCQLCAELSCCGHKPKPSRFNMICCPGRLACTKADASSCNTELLTVKLVQSPSACAGVQCVRTVWQSVWHHLVTSSLEDLRMQNSDDMSWKVASGVAQQFHCYNLLSILDICQNTAASKLLDDECKALASKAVGFVTENNERLHNWLGNASRPKALAGALEPRSICKHLSGDAQMMCNCFAPTFYTAIHHATCMRLAWHSHDHIAQKCHVKLHTPLASGTGQLRIHCPSSLRLSCRCPMPKLQLRRLQLLQRPLWPRHARQWLPRSWRCCPQSQSIGAAASP